MRSAILTNFDYPSLAPLAPEVISLRARRRALLAGLSSMVLAAGLLSSYLL